MFNFTLDDSDMAKLDSLDKGLEGKIFDMKNFAKYAKWLDCVTTMADAESH